MGFSAAALAHPEANPYRLIAAKSPEETMQPSKRNQSRNYGETFSSRAPMGFSAAALAHPEANPYRLTAAKTPEETMQPSQRYQSRNYGEASSSRAPEATMTSTSSNRQGRQLSSRNRPSRSVQNQDREWLQAESDEETGDA
jgi:hypothetical protein